MIDKIRDYGLKGDAIFAIGVIAILMLLFVPISSVVLDVLIILNISFALLILLLTFYSERPLDFSTLPSVLLLATLFRLGLNISSTRLILTDGNAGKVITSVGSYVVAGNYVIGLVIFFILVVVQFVVVTNGAQRVAEVTARFTLDSMPGKQMSIDADLNMGIIDENQAQERRAYIEKEANFYGAMDGATKFVKGDAIAGIIIILINIIGGLAIGVAQAGMPWQQALHIYTLQTVGDGIVTQIPSLVIAVGTGIIITRAATQGNLAEQLFTQIIIHPFTLTLVALVIGSAALLPGLPSFSLLLIAASFAFAGYLAHKSSQRGSSLEKDKKEQVSSTPADESSMLHLAFATGIWNDMSATQPELRRQYEQFKSEFESKYGLFLPELHISLDTTLNSNEYSIRISGIELASGDIYPDRSMVIDPEQKLEPTLGIKAIEPAYGLHALWLVVDKAVLCKQQGMTVVEPITVLITHVTEFVKRHAEEFVTRSFVDQLMEEQREKNTALVAEVVPAYLAVSDIQQIITHLVQEKVTLHNTGHVFEVLADKARSETDVSVLTEWVRRRLRNQIIALLLDESRTLNIISIAPTLERALLAGVSNQSGKSLQISPVDLEDLIKQLTLQVEKAISMRIEPVLLVNPSIRRPLWQLLSRTLPLLHIISVNEVPNHIRLNSLGVIQHNDKKAA